MKIGQGLTSGEVEESRRRHGANVPKREGGEAGAILLEVFREPMVLLLMVACIFYFLMGEHREGTIMAFAILLVSGISAYQQFRSTKAVKALNQLTRERTVVVRDGKQVEIEPEQVVVGDLVCFSEGKQISADAIIEEAIDFSVDESLLTGESLPVTGKQPGSVLFSGTTVTSGMAWAVVSAIGSATRIGKLGKSMEQIRKEKTPLQRQVSLFVKRMALFGTVAFLFVWLYHYLESGDIMHSLIHGLTLAMAVLPEEIPVALSTFMALGAYRMGRNRVLVRHPQTVEALGAATVICVDKTGTITENRMHVAGIYDHQNDAVFSDAAEVSGNRAKELLRLAFLACEEDPFDPMEQAIHNAYHQVHPSPGHFTKIHEYPLSGAQPRMTHVYRDEAGKRIIACKGAPEGLLEQSSLTDAERGHVRKILNAFAGRGERVLAIGKGIYEEGRLPGSQDEFTFEFYGLVSLADPIKANIREVIGEFYASGIHVKMITGDYPETAASIAAQAGIRDASRCVTGDELAALSAGELRSRVAEVSVFARVQPEQKLLIIDALKSNGEVVAMTGDGVNDGPALKSAHIGVAMGHRGSEVARKAASLVLIDDDLSGLVRAVAYGRNIYSNLKKAIQYIISIHIPLISVVTLPLIFGWKFSGLFLPVHVIFLELVMGPTCSIVYENEPHDPDLMKKPPRKNSQSLFTWSELSRSIFQGLMITCGLMGLLYYLIRTGHDESTARTMVFTTLVLSNIFLTLTGRSIHKTVAATLRNKNRLVHLVIGITLLILLASLVFPGVREIFRFIVPEPEQLLLCLGVAVLSVLWIEGWKMTGFGKA